MSINDHLRLGPIKWWYNLFIFYTDFFKYFWSIVIDSLMLETYCTQDKGLSRRYLNDYYDNGKVLLLLFKMCCPMDATWTLFRKIIWSLKTLKVIQHLSVVLLTCCHGCLLTADVLQWGWLGSSWSPRDTGQFPLSPIDGGCAVLDRLLGEIYTWTLNGTHQRLKISNQLGWDW